MNTNRTKSKSPFTFFLLVFAISLPFWLVRAVTGKLLLPGLPVSSLAAFSPLMAALILVYRENKFAGVIGLLKRSFDTKRIKAKAWYAPMVLLMPGFMVVEYELMRLLGWPVPSPQLTVLVPLVMFLATFIAGLGEELGWMGYAIDPLQERSNALQASILLGLVWAAWHFVLLVQAGQLPDYIIWQSLCYVPERILFVWLYNNAGKSVFAVAVFHATLNVSWQLFPVNGSYYDPRIALLLYTIAAVIVTILWGPKTLTHDRNPRISRGVQSRAAD